MIDIATVKPRDLLQLNRVGSPPDIAIMEVTDVVPGHSISGLLLDRMQPHRIEYISAIVCGIRFPVTPESGGDPIICDGIERATKTAAHEHVIRLGRAKFAAANYFSGKVDDFIRRRPLTP